MRLVRAVLTLALLASRALAQDTTALPWYHETFPSQKLGEARTIYVATPSDYARVKDRYPLLVLLDADDRPQFAAAVANIAFLTSRGAVPATIIVGVTNGRDRTHDLTPPATGKTAKDFSTAGAADTFADFIVEEVIPRVKARYRTLPTTILAGHSFGGL